jgi:hypothetical protein
VNLLGVWRENEAAGVRDARGRDLQSRQPAYRQRSPRSGVNGSRAAASSGGSGTVLVDDIEKSIPGFEGL